ncbi:uncharacterized protein LOC127961551 [Carassius gibelio]|uniref:uncharacterized protein LOC127961551 n=1 Tax=Carassius gibelio TaxID=101364 RepID=UPI0022794F2A|nr:uncharacterized protein LOC127961551 [Carassius gibelio]
MADKRHMCLLGRIILCALLTGISGAEVTRVFSSGEDVRLSCNNALSGCTSTTWIYSRPSETVELIALGIKKNNTERHERLSLGSDCSLNIKKVTKEDRGHYTCRRYVNGQQQGADARVYLHVLHVCSSSSQSEIRSGRSLTLSCQLYNDDPVSCDILVRSEGLDLIWVNQAGVNLQTDSRFQISFSSEQCNISLTTTLLNEDHNREWRCQLKHRDQLKTSATYTVKYPISPSVIVIVVAVVLAVLVTAVILWVVRKKRADNRKGTIDSVKQKDDATYTEIDTNHKSRAKKNKVHDDDKVIYSFITQATVGPQDDCI